MMAVVTVASLDGFIAVGAGGQMNTMAFLAAVDVTQQLDDQVDDAKDSSSKIIMGMILINRGPCTHGPAAERDA